MKVKISHHDLEYVMLELGRTLSYLTQSPPLTNDSTVAGGGQRTCPRSQRRLNGRAETTVKAHSWIGAVVFLFIVVLHSCPEFLFLLLSLGVRGQWENAQAPLGTLKGGGHHCIPGWRSRQTKLAWLGRLVVHDRDVTEAESCPW